MNAERKKLLETKLRKLVQSELKRRSHSNILKENFDQNSIRALIKGKNIPEGDTYAQLGTVDIDPKKLGPLSPVFTKINVKISGTKYEGKTYLLLDYSWEHPNGGTNGKRIFLKSSDDGRTWNHENK